MLRKEDPLDDLIKRINNYLLELRLAKWISQKQYKQLSVNPNETELAHLNYTENTQTKNHVVHYIRIDTSNNPNIKNTLMTY